MSCSGCGEALAALNDLGQATLVVETISRACGDSARPTPRLSSAWSGCGLGMKFLGSRTSSKWKQGVNVSE